MGQSIHPRDPQLIGNKTQHKNVLQNWGTDTLLNSKLIHNLTQRISPYALSTLIFQ